MTHGRSRRQSRYHFILATLAFFTGVNFANAAEIYDFYNGARMMGMGGAYTGVVNDETAILTNPAGLGKVRDFTFTILDPEIEAGFKATDAINASNFMQVLDIQKLLDILKNSKGTHWHLKGQAFPSFVGTNFGLGLNVKYSYDAEVDNAGTVYRYDYTNDWAAATAFCLRLFGGIIKLGAAVRVVDRVEVHKDLDATATNLSLSGVASEGTGVGADVGLIIAVPVATLPTLSMVVRDAGNTAYGLSDGLLLETSTRPADTRQTIDAGLSIFPILSNYIRMTVTAEVHDIQTLSEETDKLRRFHAGMEINIADALFLRGGMNQRYYTAGLELASDNFQLQGATYGEEIGTSTSPREDRRWIGKISIRF